MTSEYRGELKRLTRVWGPSWAARALGVSLAPWNTRTQDRETDRELTFQVQVFQRSSVLRNNLGSPVEYKWPLCQSCLTTTQTHSRCIPRTRRNWLNWRRHRDPDNPHSYFKHWKDKWCNICEDVRSGEKEIAESNVCVRLNKVSGRLRRVCG